MSSRRIDAVQWRDDGMLAFKFGDGRVSGVPAPKDLAFKEMGMSVVEYRPWARKLTFAQTNGMGFTLDVGSLRNWSPLRGRPVIYLDQNQWSTLSRAWSASHRLRSAEEHAAAVKLLKLAESGQVILPMSAAHFSETGAWNRTADRAALASTILSGSSGWQMRDPLEIRAAELRVALRASAGFDQEPLPDVFTLAPYAALDVSSRGGNARSQPEEIPKEKKLKDISVRIPAAQGEAECWLSVVARCLQLQDQMAVLELDRVLEIDPGNVNNRRLSLEEFRDTHRAQVLATASELVARMDAAATRADRQGLLHKDKAPAVVQAIDGTKKSIAELVKSIGVELALDAIRSTDWKEALKSKEHLKAAGKEAGITALKGLGAVAVNVVAVVVSKDKVGDLLSGKGSSV